jgi:thiol-disulfide isomerase/thioredoxin
MKTLLRCTLIILTATILTAQKLPQIDLTGYSKLVAAHKGKVVLVDFWATWCVPCRAEMPELVKLEQRLRARGLDVLMISTDEPKDEAKVVKVLKDSNMAAPGFLRVTDDEDKFCAAVDSTWVGGAMPGMFLYDRSGKKVRAFIGETPIKDIEAAILKLL